VLELRQAGAAASSLKVFSLLESVDTDNRVRGGFIFHGAVATGRWTGSGLQPQNLKKPKTKDLDAAAAAVLAGDMNRIRELGAPLSVVGDLSRSMICAAPGFVLSGADFSSIESRVLAWLAGEEWKLEAYRQFDVTGDPKLEPYCVTASHIFGEPVTPDDEERRQVGKTCDLAFGFAGGVGAWRKFDADEKPRSTRTTGAALTQTSFASGTSSRMPRIALCAPGCRWNSIPSPSRSRTTRST
jgi:DNA polymerase